MMNFVRSVIHLSKRRRSKESTANVEGRELELDNLNDGGVEKTNHNSNKKFRTRPRSRNLNLQEETTCSQTPRGPTESFTFVLTTPENEEKIVWCTAWTHPPRSVNVPKVALKKVTTNTEPLYVSLIGTLTHLHEIKNWEGLIYTTMANDLYGFGQRFHLPPSSRFCSLTSQLSSPSGRGDATSVQARHETLMSGLETKFTLLENVLRNAARENLVLQKQSRSTAGGHRGIGRKGVGQGRVFGWASVVKARGLIGEILETVEALKRSVW